MPARGLTGTRIRDRRSILGLKQADVAAKVGISPSYLNLIEHNRRRIGGKLLADIARHLNVDTATLSEGAETRLLIGLRAAAQGQDDPPCELDRIEDFAGRFPGWATTLAQSRRRVEALERTVATLSDRLTHDPYLSASMHEVLSTVTAIRSTASILAEPGKVDENWQARFHQNIHEDARRLSQSAQALVAYLDDAGAAQDRLASPQEEFEAWLAAEAWHFPGLEAIGPGGPQKAIDTILDSAEALADPAARALAAAHLRIYADDAARLPLADVQACVAETGPDPARIAAHLGTPLAATMRRLASMPEPDPRRASQGQGGAAVGLIACDGSGTLTFRKPVPGFQVPRFGAACPLWPLYTALRQPASLIREDIAQAGPYPARLTAYAHADLSHPHGFDGPVVVSAWMLLVPATQGDVDAPPPLETGQSCRICPKPDCIARREPSILGAA